RRSARWSSAGVGSGVHEGSVDLARPSLGLPLLHRRESLEKHVESRRWQWDWVLARHDLPRAMLDRRLRLRVREDVEAVLADRLEHDLADAARAHAAPHLLLEPLAEDVEDESGRRWRGVGQVRGPVALRVEDVRVDEAWAEDRDPRLVAALPQLQVHALRERHHAELAHGVHCTAAGEETR